MITFLSTFAKIKSTQKLQKSFGLSYFLDTYVSIVGCNTVLGFHIV